MTSDCQVLVVGAGPTGLVLACELLARGIRARIIDKGDGVVLQTRALALHARSLEVFDMMGLAERFVEHGQVVRPAGQRPARTACSITCTGCSGHRRHASPPRRRSRGTLSRE